MSEKRFTYTVDDRGFYTINDNVTGEKAVMVNDFLKWLNGLNDENEQLREQNNKYVIMMNSNAHLNEMLNEGTEQLRKENKRLKRNVKTFKEDRDSNFESAQYFREQLNKIPESIREVWIE